MAPHRVLTNRGWRWAAQLTSGALGVGLGTALTISCSAEPEDDCGSGELEPIELGAFSVMAAQSENSELNALLSGPEPAMISVGLNQVRIEYRSYGVPVSVVYDVVTKYD